MCPNAMKPHPGKIASNTALSYFSIEIQSPGSYKSSGRIISTVFQSLLFSLLSNEENKTKSSMSSGQ